MSPLGVGLTYFPTLEDFIKDNHGLIDILEVEPQTIWNHQKSHHRERYLINREVMKNIASYKLPTILHSVGIPIGGSVLDNNQKEALLRSIMSLQPLWLSEHLSFNSFQYRNRSHRTAFFLPPPQNMSGIETAINNIIQLSRFLRIPLAIENGVNYLKPFEDELPDGEFVSRIVRSTNCGLLLDLHNIWTNERNGRQPLKDFLSSLPLQNVWEIHLAGGSEDDGYWLDSHSGKVESKLLKITKQVIPLFPNLKALVFELEPSYLSVFSFREIKLQLKILHRIWNSRSKPALRIKKYVTHENNMAVNNISSKEWEKALGLLILYDNKNSKLSKKLAKDSGINVYKKRILAVRKSMLIRSLKFTCRLIMISIGLSGYKQILSGYLEKYSPEMFATTEGLHFAEYLQEQNLDVLFLEEILKFELGVISSIIYKSSKRVLFNYNIIKILEALIQRKKPQFIEKKNMQLEINPQGVRII